MLVDKERLVEYAFAEVVCFVLSDAFHWIPQNYFQYGSFKKKHHQTSFFTTSSSFPNIGIAKGKVAK